VTRPAEGAVERWLESFNAALAAGDAGAVAAGFAPRSFWRDVVALTWNIVTVEDPAGIADMLRATLPTARPRGFAVTEPPSPPDREATVEAWLQFETAVGRGVGHLRLRDGRAVTLLTVLVELRGHEERAGRRRPLGAEHGVLAGRETWLQRRRREGEALGREIQPEVVIVGGGQGGLALGARLRQLEVPTIIVDRLPRPGDQWRRRYESLCLHDPVWYDHLPYLPFPDHWPVFSPKDKIADWLEMYARVMELEFWGSTTARAARYDSFDGTWELEVERDGTRVTLRPRQLVLATGASGHPDVPVLPGQDRFAGEQHHSSAHPGPDDYAGRRAVVIGSNNSAFDICHALYEAGAQVTMVQRSSTLVVRSEQAVRGLGALYSEDALAAGITTERADLITASVPYRLLAERQIPRVDEIRRRDADFYARLQDAGFLLDWGEDGSGIPLKYLRRGSGYYIDVGGAQLIIDGRVALARGQVDHLTEDAVVLEDGTALPADLVVYATGYRSMNEWAADLISPEVADRVGKVWGLGSDTTRDPGPWEGELRNMWKPTRQPGLWFHGGNLALSRFYSRALALQLTARAAGLDTPVYGLAEVHHLR
jgi:putative flavoprotein involved in K+ transport